MNFTIFFKSLPFPMVKGSLNQNITFLGAKLWPGAWNQKCTIVIKGKKKEKCL